MHYQIITKNVKSLILRVDKNGIVKVSASKYHNREYIDSFVKQNLAWIENRLQKIPRYESGSIVRYFDEQYILDISTAKRNSIVESNNILSLKVRDISHIKKLIFKWYAKKSQPMLNSMLTMYKDRIGREARKITFKEMSSRWGSCNYHRASISLNTRLFSKPSICLEYVLLHELVHLIHPNHGKGFYSMLDSLMPNWREIKDILNKE